MKFEFTVAVAGATCHIRASGNHMVPEEEVNDRPHKHYFVEFHGVFAGKETIILPKENRIIRLLPGQILMLPRGTYHGVTTDGQTVDRACFNFSAEPLEKGSQTILSPYLNAAQPILFENPEAFSFLEQYRRLHERSQSPLLEIQEGTLLLNTVLQLFSGLAEQLPVPEQQTRAMRQRWVIEEYIEKHFTDPTGIEGLAQELFLSQRQTRTLVRRFLGEDYKQIIIQRRMELAEIYLQDPRKTLEEIAWQVGYRSYSGFQLCFKKYFGMTPTEKRMQLE